jgi:anti-sigma factor (TIGR02949 family)
MKGERSVGGLKCSEVLARLSDFVDGELGADAVEQLRQHVAGCDVCERFGDRFAKLVRVLRESGADEAEVPADVSARLHDRLRRER